MTAKIELTPANGVVHFKAEILFNTPLEPVPSLPISSYLPDGTVLEGKMQIRNPFDRNVCYRIQATHPTLFHCSPTLGVLETGTAKRIRIFVVDYEKLFGEEPTKEKKRFQMKTIFAPIDEPFDPIHIWDNDCYAAWFHTTAVILRVKVEKPSSIKSPNSAPARVPSKSPVRKGAKTESKLEMPTKKTNPINEKDLKPPKSKSASDLLVKPKEKKARRFANLFRQSKSASAAKPNKKSKNNS